MLKKLMSLSIPLCFKACSDRALALLLFLISSEDPISVLLLGSEVWLDENFTKL